MFTAVADFTELDNTVANLVAALHPKNVHGISALKGRKQVKKKYAERFKSQTRRGSNWQVAKREAELLSKGGGFPLGPEPGFLTGTTYKSIVAEADSSSGRIYPKGIWPKGVGQVSASRETGEAGYDPNTGESTFEGGSEAAHVALCFKWSMASGLEYRFWAGGAPKYVESQQMTTMRYGGVREIKWNFLNNDDVTQVCKAVEEMLRHNISGNRAALKGLYKRTATDPKLHIREELFDFQQPEELGAGKESFVEVEMDEMTQLLNSQIRDIQESVAGGRMAEDMGSNTIKQLLAMMGK